MASRPIFLNDRALANILAALRLLQRETKEGKNRAALDHFDTDDMVMTDAEIDNLCEELNGGTVSDDPHLSILHDSGQCWECSRRWRVSRASTARRTR